MDLPDLISSFSTEPAGATYPVTRRPASTIDDNGRVVPSANTSVVPIIASIQPATGRDLMRLPEGRRSIETRVVYTVTKLLTGYSGAPHEADWIDFDGQTWEVQHVEQWLQTGGDPAYRCVVQAIRT